MVSIHRPLGYGPSTLPLRHSADGVRDNVWCGFVSLCYYSSKVSGSDGDSKSGDKKRQEMVVVIRILILQRQIFTL